MANRLLDRQDRLLNYLTSGEAIFGTEDGRPLSPALDGMDRGLLNLEARFSHEKRMAKIRTVFPLTSSLLGSAERDIARAFVDAYPPVDISRLENARQFYQFLCEQWRRHAIRPVYLRDVAICEFACACVRARADEDAADPSLPGPTVMANSIRRTPGIVLLRCGHDVRPIFEAGSIKTIPEERVTTLAIALQPGSDRPGILEIRPAAFDLLTALDDWTDPTDVGLAPSHWDIIEALANYRLIEVHA
jgi:hypothetical protein